jgi:hypothetical protein
MGVGLGAPAGATDSVECQWAGENQPCMRIVEGRMATETNGVHRMACLEVKGGKSAGVVFGRVAGTIGLDFVPAAYAGNSGR